MPSGRRTTGLTIAYKFVLTISADDHAMHLAPIFARDDRAGHWPNVAVGFADLAGSQQLIDSMCISFEQSLIHLAKGALLQTVGNSPLYRLALLSE